GRQRSRRQWNRLQRPRVVRHLSGRAVEPNGLRRDRSNVGVNGLSRWLANGDCRRTLGAHRRRGENHSDNNRKKSLLHAPVSRIASVVSASETQTAEVLATAVSRLPIPRSLANRKGFAG